MKRFHKDLEKTIDIFNVLGKTCILKIWCILINLNRAPTHLYPTQCMCTLLIYIIFSIIYRPWGEFILKFINCGTCTEPTFYDGTSIRIQWAMIHGGWRGGGGWGYSRLINMHQWASKPPCHISLSDWQLNQSLSQSLFCINVVRNCIIPRPGWIALANYLNVHCIGLVSNPFGCHISNVDSFSPPWSMYEYLRGYCMNLDCYCK